MDWFPAVMTLAGVLIGVGIQEFRIWRERKDKYKDMIFEKRLEAHQGAHYRCRRLLMFMTPYKLVKDGGVSAALEEMREFSEWLHKNTLYLDIGSRTKISMFLNYLLNTVKKYQDEEWIKNMNVKEETLELHGNMAEVLLSIERGVGVNYLPEEKISIEESSLERIFDEVVEGAEGLVRKQQKKKPQKS